MTGEFIEDARSVSFPCLKLSQPVGDFFIRVIGHKVLTEISYFDVRRVLQEERDVERYFGIQRPLNDARACGTCRNTSTFTMQHFQRRSSLQSMPTRPVFPKKATRTLSNVIRDTRENSILFRHIARVLDGQHRIAGLSDYNGPEFDLNVTIFVGIDIAQQAQIFSTVNLEQTKVNKSLAYDLFELSASRSPQKTCHNVVVALDQDPTSPFYHRIKRLGTATAGRIGETLTQATFVESLLRLISADPRQDRDNLLRRRPIPPATAQELAQLPLRNLFLKGDDISIAKIIWAYFEAVRNRWPTAWDSSDRGYILNRTNGFRALMRVFRPIYLALGRPGDVVEHTRYEALFSTTAIKDGDFHISEFPPGSSGEAALVQRFTAELGL